MLSEHSDDRLLSKCFPEWFRYGQPWPLYSPDPNPCHYFLLEFLKIQFTKNNLLTIIELKQELLAVVISVSKETLAAVV
jgi:hypothetical protein